MPGALAPGKQITLAGKCNLTSRVTVAYELSFPQGEAQEQEQQESMLTVFVAEKAAPT